MKDYTCKCCDKTWSDKYKYERHLNSKKITGLPRKPQKERCDKQSYGCGLCGKTYRSNYDLNRHTSCKTKNTITIK